MRIALLGAPGTGKTWLARSLEVALLSRGHQAQVLAPSDPQLPHLDYVIVDETKLLAAVQDDIALQDKSLYPGAISEHASFDLILLTGLDLPETRTHLHYQVDARLREVLQTHRLRYSVVYGAGDQRTACALVAIDQWVSPGSNQIGAAHPRWQWVCDKCSDAQCEHQLFTSLLGKTPPNA